MLIEPVEPNNTGKWPWSELFRIRDKDRHPEFYFAPAELASEEACYAKPSPFSFMLTYRSVPITT